MTYTNAVDEEVSQEQEQDTLKEQEQEMLKKQEQDTFKEQEQDLFKEQEQDLFKEQEQDVFALPLEDFADDLLVRIFAFVLGPLEQGQYCVNNNALPEGIKLKYEHLDPTQLMNFENIITLAQVNRHWRQLVYNCKTLWKLVNIRPKKLKISQDPRSWQKFFQWLAPKMFMVDNLYMSEDENDRQWSCDQIKIGAMCCLGHNLRALHLDRCFSPVIGRQLVHMLAGFCTLEQLQVTGINHDFISQMCCLHGLERLTKVQIQGCEDYWDHSGPMLVLSENSLPQNIQVLSLSNLKISAPAEVSHFPHLTTLHLVFIEWFGKFVKSITSIRSLKHLIIQDCDRPCDEDDPDLERRQKRIIDDDHKYWMDLKHLRQLEWLELNNAQYGDFTERLGKDLSSITLLSGLRRLKICPEEIASIGPSLIGLGLSVLTELSQLHLMNFQFRTVPNEVMVLPRLQELSLAGNNLKAIPWEEPNFVSHIRRLYLDTNLFEEIPEALSRWSSLEEISLARNSFRFYESLEFLTTMPRLRKLVLGSGRGIEVFPNGYPSLIESLCDEMRLNTIGIFHFGDLCGRIKLQKRPLRIYM